MRTGGFVAPGGAGAHLLPGILVALAGHVAADRAEVRPAEGPILRARRRSRAETPGQDAPHGPPGDEVAEGWRGRRSTLSTSAGERFGRNSG